MTLRKYVMRGSIGKRAIVTGGALMNTLSRRGLLQESAGS